MGFTQRFAIPPECHPVRTYTANLRKTRLYEVRAVSMAEQRVLEAKKLGFERVILPAVCMKSVEKIGGIALIPVENIQDAILRVGKN